MVNPDVFHLIVNVPSAWFGFLTLITNHLNFQILWLFHSPIFSWSSTIIPALIGRRWYCCARLSACNLCTFIVSNNKTKIFIESKKYYPFLFTTSAFHFLCCCTWFLMLITTTFSTLTRALLSFFFAFVFNLPIIQEIIIYKKLCTN